MTHLANALDDFIDQVGDRTGIFERIRQEAAVGARAATRTPILVVGAIAVAALGVATVALFRRR